MRRSRKGALALLLLGCGRVGLAQPPAPDIEGGVICDPPEIARAVDDRFVRSEMDPSQPDINVLPTQPLVIGTFALAPDVPENERVEIGYQPYVACRPAPFGSGDERPDPRVDPLAVDRGALPEG